MTKPLNERLAVVETEIKTVKETVNKIEMNQSTNHENLSGQLKALTTLLDGHIANHEERIKAVEETIEPFTKFRKNLWYTIVFSLLGIAFYIMVQTKKL